MTVRVFDVLIDLELRIDDRSAALSGSTQEVRGTTAGRQELTKDHIGVPFTTALRR
jgi:hypothetical protein